jgi:hypothetical protein
MKLIHHGVADLRILIGQLKFILNENVGSVELFYHGFEEKVLIWYFTKGNQGQE